jgi:signal transduction histidine kinase
MFTAYRLSVLSPLAFSLTLAAPRATRVDVAVLNEAGAFDLIIRDNGRGITEDEKSGRFALGLLGMRERALLIGGEIEIEGAPGKGTTVTVRLPILRAGGQTW